MAMQRRFFLAGLGLLAACGGRLNPFTWFRRKPRVSEEANYAPPADPRGLVARVLEAKVEETSTGVLLRARGLTPMQGYHDAALVGLPVDDQGVKTFEFRLAAPLVPTGPGPEASREITVAVALSLYQLQQISSLRVVAAENALVLRP